MDFKLARRAVADLDHIFREGVDVFGVVPADSYLDELGAVFAMLCDHPRMGRIRDDLLPPVRVHPHGAHIIVYEVVGERIIILRVRHGREDWSGDPIG